MTDKRPICANCRHYRPKIWGTPDLCAHPRALDIVTGKVTSWCKHQRDFLLKGMPSDYCGFDGNWFEERPHD